MKKRMIRRRTKASPIDLIPVMTGKKPFSQSKTLIGLAVLVAPILFSRFGMEVDEEGKKALAEIIRTGGEVFGAVMVFYGRLKATKGITT